MQGIGEVVKKKGVFLILQKLVVSLGLLSFILFPTIAADSELCAKTWSELLSKHEIRDEYKSLVGLCENSFRTKLQSIISKQRSLSYDQARLYMFSRLDNVDGVVCAVYSGICIETEGIPDSRVMNCEHSWPQSKGAVGAAKSDLHHLYPAASDMNSRRGNLPFCEVVNVVWEGYGSLLGQSEENTRCFEPPLIHKGDLARAMIYFATRYNFKIDSEQEKYFRKWYVEDSLSDKEITRNNEIEAIQQNRNPFIDHPWFIELITDL